MYRVHMHHMLPASVDRPQLLREPCMRSAIAPPDLWMLRTAGRGMPDRDEGDATSREHVVQRMMEADEARDHRGPGRVQGSRGVRSSAMSRVTHGSSGQQFQDLASTKAE
jgi:hypothetical protein